MNPKVFTMYQRMCNYTFHEPLLCQNNKKHPPLYLRIEKVGDNNLTVALKCAGCEYKMYPGLARYRELKAAVEYYYGEKLDD